MSLHALASHMATKGRGGDSMLVHMTPGEVQALQTLAERHGGTLTINPETGQPEANFLKKMLPMIAGAALNFFAPGFGSAIAGSLGLGGLAGATAIGTGIGVGGISALATGSLSRGLMAGLGAYGGASLGAGLAGSGVGAAQEAAMAGLTQDQIAQQAVASGLTEQGVLNQAAADATKDFLAKGAGSRFMEGATAAFNNPKGFVQGMGGPTKALGAAYAAASPMMAADTVQTTTPRADTGYIRQKKFNPYTQQYIDLEPVKASEWGSRSFSDFANGGIVALAQGGVSDQDVQNWFATNAGATDAQIAAAMQQYKVAPEQVARVTGVGMPEVQQRFETAIAPQIVGTYTGGIAGPGGTTAVRGTGYLGIQDQLENIGVTAQELFNNPNYKGWSLPELEQAYNVANKIQQFDTGVNSAALDDKAWAKFMDDNKFTVRNIAQATGLSEAEVQRRYDAAKTTTKPPIITTTTPGGTGVATNFLTATTPATYAPPGTRNPYGNGVTPGDLTYNADGSVTVQPNIPGRPYGGFTGIQQLKDAYTAGGGSLGQSNLFVPQTTEELYERYGASGGSKQAYDYLTGKGAADIRRPVTSGQLMRPYAESVLGQELSAATGKSTQKFIFDPRTRRFIPNPAYVDPNTAKDKEEEVAPIVSEGANGGLMPQRMALGGLGSLAGGGQAGYNLGDYSDGGRLLRGPGDGVSDSIPASIGNKRPARLADGEFVVPARIVSELGNGSTEAGARKLYAMMDRVQKARGKTTGKRRVATDTRADKYLPA